MKTIRQLQTIVNEISKELDRIDTPEKLRKAEQMAASRLSQAQLLDIVNEALGYRFVSDLHKTTQEFLGLR